MPIISPSSELREMYDLLKRVPEGPKKMIERMSSHLREKGSALVQENTQGEAHAAGGQQNPVTFVQVCHSVHSGADYLNCYFIHIFYFSIFNRFIFIYLFI